MGNSFRFRVAAIVAVFVLLTIAGVIVASEVDTVNMESCTKFGSGTQDDPYRIYYASQISDISRKLISNGESYFENKYFVLKNDINMQSVSLPSTDVSFNGIIDGDGHSLSNMAILLNNLGEKGVVRNFTFNSVKTPSATYNFAVFNTIEKGGVVENCTVNYTCIIDPLKIKERAEENSFDYVYISAFCFVNRGTIRNCSVNFNWQQNSSERISQKITLSPLAITNYGTIDSCETCFKNCRFDLVSTSMTVYGFTYNKVTNCKTTGDIYVFTSQKDYSYCNKLKLFGIANSAENCENSLNLTVEYNENLEDFLIYIPIALKEENCTYSGTKNVLNKPAEKNNN